MNKAYFGVGKIKRLGDILPRNSLITIYKSFLRLDLDYGDVAYDQPNNYSFSDKIEQLRYKACPVITGTVQGTPWESFYNEGGAENFVLSINYCQLNALSTYSISYHLVKVSTIHPRNRDLFSVAELIVSNILSFQIFYLNGRNLGQKYKLGVYCSFQKQTSLFYKT